MMEHKEKVLDSFDIEGFAKYIKEHDCKNIVIAWFVSHSSFIIASLLKRKFIFAVARESVSVLVFLTLDPVLVYMRKLAVLMNLIFLIPKLSLI